MDPKSFAPKISFAVVSSVPATAMLTQDGQVMLTQNGQIMVTQ